MKILIISDVPWRNDNSVGNTYSNIFKNIENVEFSNLYCKSGVPNSKLIKGHFQLTEKKILRNLFVSKKQNNKIGIDSSENLKKNEQKIYDIARILRFQIFFILRELIWKIGRWKTKELDDYLNDLKPDIIFSFVGESIYYNEIVRYCKKKTNAKLVLFFADDIYTYARKELMYFLHKFFVRSSIVKNIELSDLLYGATPQLCKEYGDIFQKEIVSLYKFCEKVNSKQFEVNNPLKVTYTGNLFYGRWKTLGLLAEAISDINMQNTKIQLHIYTTGLITKKMKSLLNIKGSSEILGALSFEEVKNVLKNSDIVLHAESFDKREIKKTRLSFSTKIADCMESGSCLLAIGPKEVASINLLKEYGIAIVLTENEKEKIKSMLLDILNDKTKIFSASEKMKNFALENHSIKSLELKLYKPLRMLVESIGDNQ